VIGFDLNGKVLRVSDLGATGAMMVLLNEAIMPNLVQTTEHTPALIHTGPFANIAHGTSSVISQKMALRLADFVVNETGFAADLGIEKYLNIVMPSSGLKPSAAVLIVTIRSLIEQGDYTETRGKAAAIVRGFSNLAKHMENLSKFNLPFVIAINRFKDDTDDEIEMVKKFCSDYGIESSLVEVFDRGGAGALDLATKVIELSERTNKEDINPLYLPEIGLEKKIETIAEKIYGATSIYLELKARKKISKFSELGFGNLPICIAKTQSSLSDNPKLPGAPSGWNLTVTDAQLAAGAGFIVAIAGNMLLMPGLSKTPQAARLDVDPKGNIVGLL
jgi:formate--tetrahydrofolate ligase